MLIVTLSACCRWRFYRMIPKQSFPQLFRLIPPLNPGFPDSRRRTGPETHLSETLARCPRDPHVALTGNTRKAPSHSVCPTCNTTISTTNKDPSSASSRLPLWAKVPAGTVPGAAQWRDSIIPTLSPVTGLLCREGVRYLSPSNGGVSTLKMSSSTSPLLSVTSPKLLFASLAP